jgi:[ribosomal protein S18]-alanine N-acetyltransferase
MVSSASKDSWPRIRRMTHTDVAAMTLLAQASGLHVDFEAELSSSFTELWVLEWQAQDPASFALSRRVGDAVELLDLATRPQDLRRGGARRLLEHLIERARASGANAFCLELRRSNTAAMALYESLSFEVTRLRRNYYADGEDAVEMLRGLS